MLFQLLKINENLLVIIKNYVLMSLHNNPIFIKHHLGTLAQTFCDRNSDLPGP